MDDMVRSFAVRHTAMTGLPRSYFQTCFLDPPPHPPGAGPEKYFQSGRADRAGFRRREVHGKAPIIEPRRRIAGGHQSGNRPSSFHYDLGRIPQLDADRAQPVIAKEHPGTSELEAPEGFPRSPGRLGGSFKTGKGNARPSDRPDFPPPVRDTQSPIQGGSLDFHDILLG